MTLTVVGLSLRGAQVLFAIAILGLSTTLLKENPNDPKQKPAPHGYGTFLGAITLLAAFVGLASNWFEALSGLIMVIVDGFTLAGNMAGGITIAYAIRGVGCNLKKQNIAYNPLIGCPKQDTCGLVQGDEPILVRRCKQNQADSAFMFLTALVLAATMAVAWVRAKNR